MELGNWILVVLAVWVGTVLTAATLFIVWLAVDRLEWKKRKRNNEQSFEKAEALNKRLAAPFSTKTSKPTEENQWKTGKKT